MASSTADDAPPPLLVAPLLAPLLLVPPLLLIPPLEPPLPLPASVMGAPPTPPPPPPLPLRQPVSRSVSAMAMADVVRMVTPRCVRANATFVVGATTGMRMQQGRKLWVVVGALLLCVAGCAESYLLGASFGPAVPVAGSGEAAAASLSGTFEMHGGTSGVLESAAMTRHGIGLGFSQRVRQWSGITGTVEVGAHLFHLSRRAGRFGWTSRAGLLVGYADRDLGAGTVILSGQAVTQGLLFPWQQGPWKPLYVSLGAVLDATTAPPDGGSAVSFGGVLGFGVAFRGKYEGSR